MGFFAYFLRQAFNNKILEQMWQNVNFCLFCRVHTTNLHNLKTDLDQHILQPLTDYDENEWFLHLILY